MNSEQESDKHLAKILQAIFKGWQTPPSQADLLRGNAEVEQRIRAGESVDNAVYAVIKAALDALAQNPATQEPARLLRYRLEGTPHPHAAAREDMSTSTLYAKQNLAFAVLTDQLRRQTLAVRHSRERLLNHHLPLPTYTHLVGTPPKLAALLPLFYTTEAPWLIALVGMGGVGKTALADFIVRDLVTGGRFDRFAWVSAKQMWLSADNKMRLESDKASLTLDTLITELGYQLLNHAPGTWQLPAPVRKAEVRTKLSASPHLVVVDNLETVTDFENLLPFLRQLRGGSKILFTSRVALTQEGDVYNYPVPSLTTPETLELVRQEAATRNIPLLLNCTLATAERIHAATGGNPLAIRIATWQIHLHGLAPVLDDLQTGQGVGAQLHHYLYEWVWNTLTADDRIILNALLVLTSANSTAAAIHALTDLPLKTIQATLIQLVTQNLVMLEGDLEHRRYPLHALTRAFLEEVNRNHGTTGTSSPG